MRERKTEKIDAVLPAVLQQAKQRRSNLMAIQARWKKLVGRNLAAHTKPVSLRRGRLIVLADGPGESFTLSYQRIRLVERLQRVSEGRVEEIVVRPGSL